MKFLGDAQLPRQMCRWLTDGGHDVLHTLDLPLGNRTPDEALIQQADLEGLDNRALETLVRGAVPQIERAFESNGFVELGRDRLTVRA